MEVVVILQPMGIVMKNIVEGADADDDDGGDGSISASSGIRNNLCCGSCNFGVDKMQLVTSAAGSSARDRSCDGVTDNDGSTDYYGK